MAMPASRFGAHRARLLQAAEVERAPPVQLHCAACDSLCGQDWRECWVHARVHGRLLGADWACPAHEAQREAELAATAGRQRGHPHAHGLPVTA